MVSENCFADWPGRTSLINTPSVLNYRSFDFFNLKFEHSSYLKIYAKHHFFYCELLYQYKFFESDLNLTMFAQNFWIRRAVKLDVKKIKRPIIWNGGSSRNETSSFSRSTMVMCTKMPQQHNSVRFHTISSFYRWPTCWAIQAYQNRIAHSPP